ncbi:tyrosine-protein kinase RYK-like [Lineus longissimus]|uniref:tyrosine-protein kinase RYK-like n=1 Tax=Lineus longissimus TaxID=88925 RepID=UPI002B4F9C0B
MPPSPVLWFTVLFLISVHNFGDCHLNLFMNEEETWRLLGITAELFYVRNGIINKYALQFNLPIPAEITEIYFAWQNTKSQHQMFYNLDFHVSNYRAMKHPQTNVSKDGIVPTKAQVFKITLPCTGKMSAEVDFQVNLNVTMYSATNVTVLTIKRRKMCIKNDEELFYRNNNKPDDTYKYINDTYSLNDPTRIGSYTPASINYYYIGIGCMCGLILLIISSIVIYYIKTQKTRRNERMSLKPPDGGDTSSSQALSQQAFLRSETPNTTTCTTASLPGTSQKDYLNYASSHTLPGSFTSHGRAKQHSAATVNELKIDPVISLSEIAINRDQITLREVLLEGTFGRIYHGVLHVANEEDEIEIDTSMDQDIFVKTVTDQARHDQTNMMLRESCMLKDLSHKNINPIIGACLENEMQPLLLYPYSTEGNLKKFLLRCKASDVTAHALSTQQLVFMAIQVIRALQYLHRRKIVHRDVATRNMVIDSDLTIRLTDIALSRDLFPNDYHCLGDNENRPVKWLALESLIERKFSTASDLWAFGVVLWELMTLGQQPYVDVDPFEMAAYLREGYRIAQPMNCPDELFAVMACCWALSPDDRPKFSQLLVCLQDFYTALGRYI